MSFFHTYSRSRSRSTAIAITIAAGALAPLTAGPSKAESVADFYRNKTIELVIAFPPGADYDIQGRLLASHLSAHIPGNPVIVPQNMPGSGGLGMANWLYNVASRDGTVIGVLANTLPAMQEVGGPGVRFDANKFAWLGALTPSVETLGLWSAKGVRSMEDARRIELMIGASSPGTISYAFPKLMNDYLGTKFRIVTGYQGTARMNLAMERGEIDGHAATWADWKQGHDDWFTQKKVIIVAQTEPGSADLTGVPTVEAMARNDDDRQVIDLVVGGNRLGRPFATTPGVPRERVEALRAAFDATMKDPKFLRDAARANIDIDLVKGEDIQTMVAKTLSVPSRLATVAKHLIAE